MKVVWARYKPRMRAHLVERYSDGTFSWKSLCVLERGLEWEEVAPLGDSLSLRCTLCAVRYVTLKDGLVPVPDMEEG